MYATARFHILESSLPWTVAFRAKTIEMFRLTYKALHRNLLFQKWKTTPHSVQDSELIVPSAIPLSRIRRSRWYYPLMPVSVHCTGINFFACCQPQCTVLSWVLVRVLYIWKFSVLDSGWNLKTGSRRSVEMYAVGLVSNAVNFTIIYILKHVSFE